LTEIPPLPARRFWREPFSTVSHLFGLLLSLALFPLLVFSANGRIPHLLGGIAFGASLVLLYTASTLCHGVVSSPKHLRWLIKFDHAAIFLLILGTYTPVCLVTLSGTVGWVVLAMEAALALIGIGVVALHRDEYHSAPLWKSRLHEGVRVGLYLVMGWLILAFARPLFQSLSLSGAAWLVGGGVAYSLGAVVFVTDKPHLVPGKFSAHDLWHLFVLAGSFLHFTFITGYVLPK